jgi:hypothetical protein
LHRQQARQQEVSSDLQQELLQHPLRLVCFLVQWLLQASEQQPVQNLDLPD